MDKKTLRELYNEIDERIDWFVTATWELSDYDQKLLSKLFKYQDALKEVLKIKKN